MYSVTRDNAAGRSGGRSPLMASCSAGISTEPITRPRGYDSCCAEIVVSVATIVSSVAASSRMAGAIRNVCALADARRTLQPPRNERQNRRRDSDPARPDSATAPSVRRLRLHVFADDDPEMANLAVVVGG